VRLRNLREVLNLKLMQAGVDEIEFKMNHRHSVKLKFALACFIDSFLFVLRFLLSLPCSGLDIVNSSFSCLPFCER